MSVVEMPRPETDELVLAVVKMRRSLLPCIESAVMTAKIRKAAYDASIAEGFSPEQALILCQKPLG